MDYNIVWVRGHVEVYDWAGRGFASRPTMNGKRWRSWS